MENLIATLKITVSLALAVLLWGSSYVGIRIGLQSYSPGSLALLRYLVASIGMAFLYLFFSKRNRPSRKDLPWILFMGVTGFAIYNIALNSGEITVSAGISSFIVGQLPVLVAILAAFLLKEKLTRLSVLGMVISFIGISLIAISHHHDSSVMQHFDLGIFYLIIATFSGAAYSISYKLLASKYEPISLTAFGIWSGSLVLLYYMPSMLHEVKSATASANWAVLYLGLFPAVIGYLAYNYVLKFLPVSRASSYLFIVPLVSTLLGWLILGEIPTWLALVGGMVALLGTMITIKYKSSQAISQPIDDTSTLRSRAD